MRLVIVGAGSQSTPHLAVTPQLLTAGAVDLTLVGRDDDKTRAVARAIQLLNPACRVQTSNLQDDLTQPFATADAIVVQPRYGGFSARLSDETFPHRYGFPGDEGLGLGGLANAWRSWPHLARLLERISAVSPHANIVFLTAPLGILTRCALAMYPSLRWYAVCELPVVTIKDACASVGAQWQTASFDYAGINHLGWFDRLQAAGHDLLSMLGDAPDSSFPGHALISELGALPLKYLELHYNATEVVERQRASVPRSEVLRESAQRAISAYATEDRDGVWRALSARGAPWYRDAVAPLLAYFGGGDAEVPLFLTVRNDGYLPALEDADVVEVPHVTVSGKLQRVRRQQPLRQTLSATLEGFVRYERLAAEAVLHRDEAGIASAIAAHPWIAMGVEEMARDVLTGAGDAQPIER